MIIAGAGGGGKGTLTTRLIASVGATVLAVDLSQESPDKHVAPLAAEGLSVIPVKGDVGTRERDAWAMPMARQGKSEEIAGTVLYLLWDMGGYTTGQHIAVDGGMSVKWSYIDRDNVPAYARTTTFLDD